MKTKTIRIPVAKDRIALLSDPTGQGHETMYAYVKVTDLPMDLPLDVNPRAQNLHSRVAKQIQSGLMDESNVFHLLNRGLTVTAYDADYDTKKEVLSIQVAGGFYGLVDGGHTYSILRNNVAPYLGIGEGKRPGKGELGPEKEGEDKKPAAKEEEVEERPAFLDNAYVRMEIMVGVKNGLLVDVARTRNTSAQVKDESLANLEGSFEWLKETLARTPYAEQIAYKENEDDANFPIDVREIIALLTLFHPNFQDSEKPPIMGYTSKGRCLDLFRENPEGYQVLRPIMSDILKLYDYIHLKFAELYKEIGGLSSLDEDKAKTRRGVKLAKVIGVKSMKEGFPLNYIGEKAFYLFPDGWLLPVLSSLRSIVSYKTDKARWKVNPFQFFDKTGKQLVSMTLETSVSVGRNPNAVGKLKPHWVQLHAHELNQYLKMLNLDTDQNVTIGEGKEKLAAAA